jgi:CspA family cold shock protein
MTPRSRRERQTPILLPTARFATPSFVFAEPRAESAPFESLRRQASKHSHSSYVRSRWAQLKCLRDRVSRGVRSDVRRYGDAIPPRPRDAGEERLTMTGTIRTLRVDKGFGFIKDTNGQEYFFHQSAIYGEGIQDLREGDSVEFDVGQGPKGPRAENVRRTST